MIKDTRYIIKRIIIGVAISLILSFIYACDVKAEGTTDIEFENYNLNYNDTSTATERILFSNSNGIYKNWGRSNLIFTLTIYRYSENTSVNIPMLTEVRVRSNNNTYISCDIGNNPLIYSNGDIMKANTYNVLCDTSFGSVGLQEIRAFFQPVVNTPFGVQTSTQMVVYKNIEDRTYTLLKSIINNQGIINNSITGLNTLLNTKLQEIITYQYNESVAISHLQDTITTINNNIINLISAINSTTGQIIQKQEETTSAVNDVNDTLNNDDVDSPSNSLADMNSNLATNSVISDLFTLPIRFYQTILNSVNNTCTPYTLGQLFNTDITLPCIDIEDLLGTTIYTTIDIGLCGIFVFSIRKKFVDIFSNITSLKDRGNELE